MMEWEDLQIGILWTATYSPYGSVTMPAKHTPTMYIKRLTRQALYREVRISQARCSIDVELRCKSNFAGCCDVLFVSLRIHIYRTCHLESFTEIAQLVFPAALHICVGFVLDHSTLCELQLCTCKCVEFRQKLNDLIHICIYI